MLSAFGVDHGLVSKSEGKKRQVPDWASGAIPASAAHAYNRSNNRRVEAAARNVGATTLGTAAGTALGASLVGLAFRRGKATKRIPQFMYRNQTIHNPITGRKTTITSGEKQRYLGMTLGGTLGTVGGGVAGAAHLNRVKRDRRYGYEEPEK